MHKQMVINKSPTVLSIDTKAGHFQSGFLSSAGSEIAVICSGAKIRSLELDQA